MCVRLSENNLLASKRAKFLATHFAALGLDTPFHSLPSGRFCNYGLPATRRWLSVSTGPLVTVCFTKRGAGGATVTIWLSNSLPRLPATGMTFVQSVVRGQWPHPWLRAPDCDTWPRYGDPETPASVSFLHTDNACSMRALFVKRARFFLPARGTHFCWKKCYTLKTHFRTIFHVYSTR